MRVNREGLLKVLESLSPGLSRKESVEQSSCIVFRASEVPGTSGRAYTFNEEICCRRDSPVNITGAVRATPLLNMLSKIPDDEIDVTVTESLFQIKGSGRKTSIRMESQIELPIDSVEVADVWRPLPKEFSDAAMVTHACVSADDNQFKLSCVHIHPEYVEACDRYQIARYHLKGIVEEPILVRGESLKKVVGYDMTEVSETDNWVHFRNPAGLVLSCRRFLDEYRSLDEFVKRREGEDLVTLPAALGEVLKRCEEFSKENTVANHVVLDFSQDKLILVGEGPSGQHREMKRMTYNGKPIRFSMSPKLLMAVMDKSLDCYISDTRMWVDTGKFVYAASVILPDSKTE